MTSSAERLFLAIVCAAIVVAIMGALAWWVTFAFSLSALPAWASVPIFFAPFVFIVMLIGSFMNPD